ncbi:MAG: outer membrane beta-barrel protein [Luteolibacter sp.]|nr:outer membrane beta-barrel protein [Luteolibacter sp.]
MPVSGSTSPLPGLENAVGNCVISGEVSDATSLNPVAGAFVDVVGTGRTAETDAKGRFSIGGLPAGSFTLEATKLGYFTESTVVTTLDGQPAEVRFGLRLKPADDTAEETTLEEETIVGEYSESSQGDLFLDLQVTPSIAAGISKEEFTRAAVSDAAGAVSKISGANIIGGKYAVVRGLGDRYSNTTLNGSLISSADPSRKAVQLDLFPSHLLQSIKIDKTFLPYMPAEFAGGLVGIQTLRFPDEPIIDFKIGMDGNSNLGKGDDFYVIKGRDLGFWGNSNDGALPVDGLSKLGNGTAAEQKAVMEDIHTSQGFRAMKDDPDALPLSLEATLGQTFDLTPDMRLGVVAAFTHEKGDEATLDYQVGRRFLAGAGVNNRSFTKDEYTRYVEWGGLFSAGLQIGEQHDIGYVYFTNNNSRDTVTLAKDVNTPETADVTLVNGQPKVQAKILSSQGIYDAAHAIYRGFDQIEPLFRSLDVNQLSGRHSFDEENRGPAIDWGLAFSESLENRPHTSTFFTSILDFTDPRIQDATFFQRLPNPNPPPRFITVEVPEVYEPSRGIQETAGDPLQSNPPEVESFRESLKTSEESTDANMAVTLPYYFDESGDNRFELRFGAANFEKKREVRGSFVTYRIPQNFNNDVYQNPTDNGQTGIDDAANVDSLQLPDGSDRFDGTTNGLHYVDFTGRGFTERNVNASTEVDATFLMGSFHVDKWEITGGYRHETENRGFELLTESGAFRSGDEQENNNGLFGITLIRTFGDEDNHIIQAAASRTIARPTFYEFAPVFTTDQASGDSVVGNPDLVDSLIENFDLAYSYSPAPGIRYALNFFHKSVSEPIVKVLSPTGVLTWVNGQGGSIQGLEIEAEKRFNEHWSLTANYTHLESLLRVSQESAGRELRFETTFEGQPDLIANLILGYDHADWGIRTSLVYNYTGQFLVALASDPSSNPSVVQLPYHSLDFVISKDFKAFGYDGVASFKVTNLLDSDVERVNEGVEGDNGIYDKYSPGRGFTLSCKISF